MSPRAIAFLSVLLLSHTAVGAGKDDLPGNWKSTSGKTGDSLQINVQGTYQWNAEKGRWMTQGSSVWFLTDNRVGTKWDFSFENDFLLLKNPENFKYEGGGNYLYFQMTDPKTVHKLKKVVQGGDPSGDDSGPEAYAGQLKVDGSLGQEEILSVVRTHIAQIQKCRTQVLKPSPALSSKVVVNFTIGTEGRVTDAKIASTTLAYPEVEKCMLRRIKQWKFPAPREKPTKVSCPFVFRSN